MATTIGALRVELSANIAKFEAAMGKAATHMARTQRSFERFGSRASAAGRSLSVGLTAPLVAVGALSAKSFLSFEQGMNNVAAVSGATGAEMAELTAIAKDLGATTSFSAAQAAEGLGFLAQAGFDATEAGRALPGVLQLAAAGGIELAAAADIATNVLAGYGLEVDQLARVNDVLAKASISTNTNVQQLGDAFKFSGAVASSAGISFEEAGAAMALMGNAGIQAEMAGTSLQQAIFRLVKPTNEAAGVMEKLGIHGTDAHGRLLPLDQIVEQLEPHFKNTAAMATIFGSRAIKGMGALVAEGSDKLRALTTELEQAGGTAQEVADKKLAGLTGAWTRLQSATEGVFIEIGTRLSPVLERLAAFLTDRVLPAVRGALEAFDRWSPGMQTAVIAATAVTAALGPLLIALGGVTAMLTPLLPLLVALGKTKAVVAGLAAVKTVLAAVGITATTTWAAILGPLALVVAGVAAVALAFTHWDAIRETLGLVESQAITTTDKLEEARTALERMSKTSRRANIQRRRELKAEIAALEAQVAEQDRIQASWETRKAGWDRDRLAREAKAAEAAAVTAAAVARQAQAVQTLVDRLRGTGAIQAAHNWAAAVEDVGGLTRLTDQQTADLNETLQAARSAYQRLGDEAPAHLVALAAETGRAVARAREPLQGLAFGFVSVSDRIKTLVQTQGIAADGTRVFGQRIRLASKPLKMFGVTLVPRATTSLGLLKKKLQQAPSVLDRFTGSLRSLWEGVSGGQGMSGVFAGIGAGITQGLGNLISGGLASLANVAVQGIVALGKKIGGVFTRIFGGPSEAERAGRQAWRSYADGLAAEADAEQVQQALGAGWANVEDAKAWIVLRDAVTKAGGSAADAEGLWHRYVAAIKQGPEAVAAVTRELDGWRQKAGEVAQAETELAARNTELAGSLAGLVEAGHAAFDPAQLDPYLTQMQELGLITADEAASLRQMADDAHVDWRGMEAAAKQYGVGMKTVLDESGREVQVLDESLLGLGHAQAKLTDEGGQLASAWELLTDEGGHMQAAIEGMTDEAQGFVTKALEMGIALPASMKPMLEAMVEQGRLTDQDGEKLEDLSGLTFADPIAAQFDRLADSIQMLIIALGGPSGLSKAVEDMAASANLEIKGLAGEWAGMTDEMKTEFGSFAAFVEDRALREIAESAGLNYDAIAAKWKGMTDAQKTEFGSFREFLKNEELKQLATDAGLTFDDLQQQWKAMTDAQRTEAESFREFVNDELAKINDRTVTVTTQHQTEGAPAGVDNDDHEQARHGTPFRQFGSGTPAMLHGLERVMTAPEGRGIASVLARIQQGLGAIAELSGVQALATGTPGLGFQDFGAGSLAVLHGREAVVPQSRAADFAAQHADMRGLAREVQGLREDLTRADQRFATTLRSVLAKA